MLKLADFAGRWDLTRRIEDALGGSGRFSGTARFTATEAGLRYEEEGQLDLDRGGRFSATRRYEWRSEAAGVAVYFENGTFFHRFSLVPAPEAAHFCDPDQYDVTYGFSDWPDWTSRWRVRGPRKDYVMESAYRRAG